MPATAMDEEVKPDCVAVKRAIISVSDKTGLVELAMQLVEGGVEIFSTGGTRLHLEQAGLAVQDISAYTGFPEMMDGRLKTLHPKVFGGILARHDRDDDLRGLADQSIHTFELVVVNLYPFEQTIARAGVTDAEAVEQIDIGGPSLVRAAAKNHRFTAIVTSPGQYATLLRDVQQQGGTTLATRQALAGAAFHVTAHYDRAIADYFANTYDVAEESQAFAAIRTGRWLRRAVLRYGENPHQAAALYANDQIEPTLVTARQLNGKELSYNNYLDLDAALEIARSFVDPCVAVIKHNNPCGVACDVSLAAATAKALAGDPLSAFGSVLGFNRAVDAEAADVLTQPGLFVEAIVAPRFSPEALELLTTRPKWKKNVRLLEVGQLPSQRAQLVGREIAGGLLVQTADNLPNDESEWKVVTEVQPDARQLDDLRFAWTVVRHVRSNAIAVCRDLAACGVGAGQMSRVDAVEIALQKAGERSLSAVLASDAFFPFADSIEQATQAGIVSVIQPGGSKKDQEVIAACNQHELSMIFTGRRHFKH